MCGSVGYLGDKLESFCKSFHSKGLWVFLVQEEVIDCHVPIIVSYRWLWNQWKQPTVQQSIKQRSIWWICSWVFKTEWQLHDRGEMKEKWKKTLVGTWLETRFPSRRRYRHSGKDTFLKGLQIVENPHWIRYNPWRDCSMWRAHDRAGTNPEGTAACGASMLEQRKKNKKQGAAEEKYNLLYCHLHCKN